MLSLGEAVDLIEKENRAGTVEIALGHRVLHHFAHVFHTRRNRAQLDESPTAGTCDRLRKRGFARAWWPPQDNGHGARRSVPIGKLDERRPRTQQVLLPRYLLQRGRAHPHGERSLALMKRSGRGHTSMVSAAPDAGRSRRDGPGSALPHRRI